MNGYRFYLEFDSNKSKRKSGRENTGHTGLLALFTAYDSTYIRDDAIFTEGISSHDGIVSCHWEYLQANCKRISESKASEFYPAFFERLKSEVTK